MACLPAGADDDLIGLGGQAPVGDAGGQGRPQRGQAPGAVARRRLHRRQVGGRHADIVQAAGVVGNGEREIDEIARGVAAFDQVVHEDTALATGRAGSRSRLGRTARVNLRPIWPCGDGGLTPWLASASGVKPTESAATTHSAVGSRRVIVTVSPAPEPPWLLLRLSN